VGVRTKNPNSLTLGDQCRSKPPFVFCGISPSRRSLGSYAVEGDPPMVFLISHIPMKRFFDWTDQENSKREGAKGQIRKIQKNKKERMEERKRSYFVT
jgi:hypothetical protein